MPKGQEIGLSLWGNRMKKKGHKSQGRPFWGNQPVKRSPLSMQDKIDRVMAAISTGALKPGTVTHVSVQHDPGCPALRSENLQDCTCDPDVKVMKADA